MNTTITDGALAIKRYEDSVIDTTTGELLRVLPKPAQPAKDLASLFKKIAGVMGRINMIPKNGYNQHHGYNYATASDVSDAIRHAMAAENLALFMSTVGRESADDRLYVYYRFTFADGETGATWDCDWSGEVNHFTKTKDGRLIVDDKSLNKAATTARKYFLMSTFQVSTGDEEDVDGEQNKPARSQTPAKQNFASNRDDRRVNTTPKTEEPATPKETNTAWFTDAALTGGFQQRHQYTVGAAAGKMKRQLTEFTSLEQFEGAFKAWQTNSVQDAPKHEEPAKDTAPTVAGVEFTAFRVMVEEKTGKNGKYHIVRFYGTNIDADVVSISKTVERIKSPSIVKWDEYLRSLKPGTTYTLALDSMPDLLVKAEQDGRFYRAIELSEVVTQSAADAIEF